jgi:dihydrofolate reductase
MPWRLPDDLARFRSLTIGHAVIMGHATFSSLARPLARRLNIVMSRDRHCRIDGCVVARTAEDALAAAARELPEDPEVFVIGGSSIYALFLPRAELLRITWVDAELPGDTFFPEVDWNRWQVRSEERGAPASSLLPHRFVVYERSGA